MSANQSGDERRRLKAQLRRQLRQARRSLSPSQRTAANERLSKRLAGTLWWRRARNIAAFLAFDGEPSLAGLTKLGARRGKRHFVPIIRRGRMKFAPLDNARRMTANSFGIAEPRTRRQIATRQLDIVLVPLVGFDANGNRLGMGGGFYDRHFNFLRMRSIYRKPRLIGVAYELQRADELPVDDWDIPLQAIVTDHAVYKAPST